MDILAERNQIVMNKLTQNKRLPLFMIFGLLILLLAALVLWNANSILGEKSKLLSQQILVEENRQRLTYLQKISADGERLNQDIDRYQKMLPDNIDQQAVFSAFKKLADQYGVTISSLTFDATAGEAGLVRQPLQLVMSGNYTSAMTMLEDLVCGERLILLDSLSLANIPENSGSVTLNAALSVYSQQ